MADESARLVIQADTDEILQAATEVERLRRAMDEARDAVLRTAPGWEMQARNLAGLSVELGKAEAAYERVAVAAQTANRAAAGGGSRMDAGRASQFGFNLANTLQDAAYNPAYAVNNVLFMAQQSGGIKELGKDLKEFTVIAAAAAGGGLKAIPGLLSTIATAAAGASGAILAAAPPLLALAGAALTVNKGLKDAGLGWSDFIDVMANTKPVIAAGDVLHEVRDAAAGAWETLSNTQAGEAVDSVWDGLKNIVHETANATLGWDDATEAVKRNKEATAEAAIAAAEWAKQLAEAQSALKNVKSDEQKKAAESGGELVQNLANLGGKEGLEGSIKKIAALGMVDEEGRAINADQLRVDMAAAQKGDEAAAGRVRNYAQMAGLDPDKAGAEAAARKADFEQAGRTSGFLRQDFEKDLGRVQSGDDFALAMDRINRAFEQGRLSEEDYAAVMERATAVKERAAEAEERGAEAAREKAAAEARAAEASRNAAEASALEAEQKAALANYDRRVDRRVELYGGQYGGAIAQAQLMAAQRGEDQETTDARLREQLMARMKNVDPSLRRGTADEIIKRSRMMAEDYAVQVGAQRDFMGAALGEQAVRGDQRTFIGQMNRQQALAAGRAMGIDVNAYGKDIEAAAPTKAAEEQMKAAKIIYDAAKVIERVQVTI